MKSPRLFTMGVLALIPTTTLAQYEDPSTDTPDWVTPTITFPSPYAAPSIFTTTDSAGACLASLQLYSSISCAVQTTEWLSTTTLKFGVDCLGCSNLDWSYRRNNCPMGGHHTPKPPTTITAVPRTRWDFVCAPTLAPAGPVTRT